MLLLIDNYDSFTFNLVHYLGELGADVTVRRNDALDVQEALALKPAGIVLSPGPCAPDHAGICRASSAPSANDTFSGPTVCPITRVLGFPTVSHRPSGRS